MEPTSHTRIKKMELQRVAHSKEKRITYNVLQFRTEEKKTKSCYYSS
jgi:hypothetical protein